jgi:hypothetical protein
LGGDIWQQRREARPPTLGNAPRTIATSPDRRSSEQRFESDKDERRCREGREQRSLCQRLARRQPSELAFDEFEIVAYAFRNYNGLSYGM